MIFSGQQKAIDAYNPEMNTAILRKFSLEMEISEEEAESLFDSYLSSPRLIALGKIIRETTWERSQTL